MEFEVGTEKYPIYMIPRIEGVERTVTQIKTIYSNAYINDIDTPMSFGLEYKSRDGSKTVVEWDPAKSSDSVIYFAVPDVVYASVEVYTVLFFWKVVDGAAPATVLEKIYTLEPVVIDVKELHNQ